MRLSVSNLRFTQPQTPVSLLNFLQKKPVFKEIPLSHPILLKSAIDHRKKNKPVYCYTLQITAEGISPSDLPKIAQSCRAFHFAQVADEIKKPLPLKTQDRRVLVVGMGPAGLFAAYSLLQSGFKVTLLERGKPVEQRRSDVARLATEGVLDRESNICFGEGGAGTFSDGKLTTRKNHPQIRNIFETLVQMGAPEEILFSGKPHIGTDRLSGVLVRFRETLLSMGAELAFQESLIDFEIKNNRIASCRTSRNERSVFSDLILAIGHSARDTFSMLQNRKVALDAKPFALGVRCEHPQQLINRAQYGDGIGKDIVPADYRLALNLDERRSIYSFCMCPGGSIVCSSTEPGGLCVNGMSDFRRSSPYANAAIVVKTDPTDYPALGPLSGILFQQQWEHAAFIAGGRSYTAPVQRITDFLAKKSSQSLPTGSYRPGMQSSDLHAVLPPFVTDCLKKALPVFDRKIRGFVSEEAILVGIETRTSSPVRILRGPNGTSPSADNLYPTGEGAGYSGGIVSSALDGMRVAEKIIEKYR